MVKFVGRDQELAVLESLWAKAASERAQVAVVAGDAGIGKSRLVTEFMSRALGSGDVVAAGQCVELFDHTLSFGPVVQALRCLAHALGPRQFRLVVGHADVELSRLAPDLFPEASIPRSVMPDSAGRLFDAVSQLLGRTAGSGRLLVVIEDLQWADRATLDLLAYLARTLGQASVLVLATVRTEALGRGRVLRSWIAELVRMDHVHQLRLRRLEEDAVVALAAELGAGGTGDRLAQAVARSEGNPFYLEELIASNPDVVGHVPEPLREFLAGRIERLPAPAVVVVGAAAVAGLTVPHGLLKSVINDPTTLSTGLRALVDEQILVAADGSPTYRFRHALLREAVLLDLLPGERAELHRQVALALEADPGLVVGGLQTLAPQLAAHWDAAGERSRALTAAITAGRVLAGMGVSGEATIHFERALALWATVSDAGQLTGLDQAQLLIEAAQAYEDIGEYRQAASHLETARSVLPRDDGTGRYDLAAARLGWAKLTTGDGAGLDMLTAVIDRAEGVALGWALAWRSRHNLVVTRFDAALPDAERATEIAERYGEQRLLAHSLTTLASLKGTQTDADVDPLFDRARAAAERAGAFDLVMKAYMNQSHVYNYRGRVSESYALNRSILPMTERPMPLWHRIQIIGNIAMGALQGGDFLLAKELLSSVPDAVSDNRDAVFWRCIQCHTCTVLGDYELARSHLAFLEGSPARRHVPMQPMLATELIRLRTQLGWAKEEPITPELAKEAVAVVSQSNDRDWKGEFLLWAIRTYALAPVGPGFPEAVRSLLDTFSDVPTTGAWHRAAVAEATWILTGPDPDLFSAAASAFDERPDVVEAGLNRVREVEAALASGDRARAQVVLDATYPAVQSSQFRLAGDLLRRIAARAGLKVPGTVSSPSTSMGGLTTRELDVLAGLARGLSNKQIGAELFVGVRTVETHVSNVLSKLGVSSRGEAAEAARTRHLLGPATLTGPPESGPPVVGVQSPHDGPQDTPP